MSLIQLRLAAGNLDRAQLAQINGWLGVSGADVTPGGNSREPDTQIAAGFDDRTDHSQVGVAATRNPATGGPAAAHAVGAC